MNDDARKPRLMQPVIWWVIGLTVVYIAAAGWFFAYGKQCPAVEGLTPQFPASYLSCLSVDALGNILAGAFAPLAFFWLAAAVFIQSQELQAQRQELSDTREVMRAQADEARNSANYLKEQADILRRDHEDRKQSFQDMLFDTILSQFIEFMQGKQFVAFVYYRQDRGYMESQREIYVAIGEKTKFNMTQLPIAISPRLLEFENDIAGSVAAAGADAAIRQTSEISSVLDIYERLIELSKNGTPRSQASAVSLNLREGRDAILRLLELMDQVKKMPDSEVQPKAPPHIHVEA